MTERFGEKREEPRSLDVSGSGKKINDYIAPPESPDHEAILDSVVYQSDTATHKELVTVLDGLMNDTSVQPEWASDLSEPQRNTMNSIVHRYYNAKKSGASLDQLLLLKKEFEKLFVI